MQHTVEDVMTMDVKKQGCTQTERVFLYHLTWLLNKAAAAVSANALKGKHKRQSCCRLATIWLHFWQSGEEGKEEETTVKVITVLRDVPGYSLVSGTPSIFMKLQTQGYRIPCVQMWSQQETDCLCWAYFHARHEGALFKVNCVRRCQKSGKVRDNFSPCSNRTFTTQWPAPPVHLTVLWRDWYAPSQISLVKW